MDTHLQRDAEQLLRVGITHGDFNGVGYEVMLKSLADSRITELFTPVIYGHARVAAFYRKNLALNELNFVSVRDASQIAPHRVNLINCTEVELRVEMGLQSAEAGQVAVLALEMAIEDLKKGLIDVLVTAPVNKENIQSDSFRFPGHTEFLAEHFSGEPLMLMVWRNLRVGVVTGHVPLAEVSRNITTEGILRKLNVLNNSLIRDFGIRRPRIAVLGLNPHAGDGGLLGNEEHEIILPAINQARDQKEMLVYGPFGADGFFGAGQWKKYDGVLAMFHDQGLAPFKTIAAGEGVNFTAGLPIVRTSPAHGTAYDIVGKNLSEEDAFRQALYLAVDIERNRRSLQQLEQNQLDTEKYSI
ncbi:MAG TPA: 4-hydroxythreonine-4-phosphate dehydrogenase PdxA [Bacteroidales bacterium]|nr:4-hydroxythreonine-4-phosphate dehydrogenase PdxA [Bacteroidales bacterium]